MPVFGNSDVLGGHLVQVVHNLPYINQSMLEKPGTKFKTDFLLVN